MSVVEDMLSTVDMGSRRKHPVLTFGFFVHFNLINITFDLASVNRSPALHIFIE